MHGNIILFKQNQKMKNFFSVDLEDWYQGIGIPIENWGQYEKRLEKGTNLLLELFQKYKAKATFFTLGKVLEEHVGLIKTIASEGHEIACHTYSHPFLYKINQKQFEDELLKCQNLSSQLGINLKGFRAPYFSVDHRSLYVLESLKKFNYQYDSSIYPGNNLRTGISNANPDITQIDDKLIEVPITNFKFYKYDIGTGGAYFRILPYAYFKKKLKAIEKLRPINFYIHPWELDTEHPVVKGLPKRIQIPHYFNLKSTQGKLEKLFGDFEFTSFEENLNLIKK